MAQFGESSSLSTSTTSEKPVIVRVKRKADQSPLEALWLEINERPLKRPLIDFEKLSISGSSVNEELNIRRVLVQHVETVSSSEASIDFLQLFMQPSSDGDSKFRDSNKERRCTLRKEKKHDQLLSKAKQDHEDLAKSARFEQIWKHRRGNKEAIHDEGLGEVCRVYDVLRVDVDETSNIVKKSEELMSVDDQEALSRFLPLLRECIPSAAQEIESDIIYSHAAARDVYVYDLYTVNEKINDAEASYPFPLVQVDDDDDFYDGPDNSDYETDDSNAEHNPLNDYPEEESSNDGEEESERSSGDSDKVENETESDEATKSDDSWCPDRSKDPLYDDEIDEYY